MIDNNIIPEWSAMSTAQKANFIRYAVSALRRGEPIDLTNLAEAWRLFYGDYLLACGGKLYSEGGHIYSGEEEPTQQMNKNITPWKALDNIEHYAIPDTSFTRDKTGIGDIEYFSSEHPEGITYPNGYHRDHPMPGKDILLYNPNNNDTQDIRLDALHIMPKDATYDALNLLYREAAKDGDVAYNAKRRYEEDVRKYGEENIDSYEQYFNNEADGLLRNMLIEGSPEYIESKRYYPNKEELKQWNNHLLPYINNIQHYLETGKRPDNILKEVTVTAPKKKALGGNLFSGTKTNTLNLKDLKIGVRDIISYINKYKAADYWTLDDINYLAGKLYSTGWDPEAILYVIGTESSYNPNAANPVSSARGLALITNGTASDIFGEKNYKSIMNQYNSKKRTTHDSIDDAFRYYSHIDKLITKNRDNMGYGRLKVNMLAPYATLDTAIKNVNGIYDSLTSNQKKYVASLEKKLGRKATFADLMEMYDKEFNSRDRKKELIEYAPPAVDLDTPVNIPSIIMPTDAILLQEVPIMPEAAAKISYIPTNPVNNYVEATTEKTSGEELAGLKALNAFREAMSFNHMMLDLNRLLYSELPVWDPLGVINNPLEFFKLKGNGGNLLALGTNDTEDPEEYSGWLSEFNVTPTSSGQYLQGYDENGRKVYTVDPNQRMSNNFTADRLARWDENFRNSLLPNTGEQWANIATGAIGLPMIATNPVTGALVSDLASDLITHPIANIVGFGTGYLGNKVDKSLGITSAVNNVLPDKINLPEGTIGEFVGYPLGRFSKEIGTGLANVADWTARKAYAPYDFYRTVSETTLPIKEPYLNVGWAPKQTFNGYHASNDPWFVPDFWKENWAVREHGAPYGVYIAEGEKPTSGFLTNRPYIYQTETMLEKPFVLVGEVSGIGKNATRNEIERQALLMGADGIIYQGIRDNQMPNLTILKTLNPDTKVNVKYPLLDKLIRKNLFDAEEYKASEGYKQLIERAREESTDMGFGDFPNSLFLHKTLKSPDIILESRPRRKLAAYRPLPNEISIDPAQLTEKTAETVPFHEGLHWQRVGEPEGPLYKDWAKSFYSNDSKQIQSLKFDKYYDSPEYLSTKNARNYLAHKIESALYGDADEYLKKPGELQILGLETGKALGIKPFTKYPGDKEALEIIEKAREYSPWWGDIRTYTSKHLKDAWDILTGNFIPSALPFATLFGIDVSKKDSGNLLNK